MPYTRTDYLNQQCTHQEYYAQFVNEGILRFIREKLGDRILNSQNEYFNDIDLIVWDSMHIVILNLVNSKLLSDTQEAQTTYSIPLSSTVCIAKAAAYQLKHNL